MKIPPNEIQKAISPARSSLFNMHAPTAKISSPITINTFPAFIVLLSACPTSHHRGYFARVYPAPKAKLSQSSLIFSLGISFGSICFHSPVWESLTQVRYVALFGYLAITPPPVNMLLTVPVHGSLTSALLMLKSPYRTLPRPSL